MSQLGDVCKSSIAVISIKNIKRSNDEDIQIAIVIYIHERQGAVGRSLRSRLFDSRPFRPIRKVPVTVVVIENETLVVETRNEQIGLAIVIEITDNCRGAVVVSRDR